MYKYKRKYFPGYFFLGREKADSESYAELVIGISRKLTFLFPKGIRERPESLFI